MRYDRTMRHGPALTALAALITLIPLIVAAPVAAEEPEIVAATVTRMATAYRVDVTVRHPDTGWDHYADGWEVLDGSARGSAIGPCIIRMSMNSPSPARSPSICPRARATSSSARIARSMAGARRAFASWSRPDMAQPPCFAPRPRRRGPKSAASPRITPETVAIIPAALTALDWPSQIGPYPAST